MVALGYRPLGRVEFLDSAPNWKVVFLNYLEKRYARSSFLKYGCDEAAILPSIEE